jgi:hypothetical protein
MIQQDPLAALQPLREPEAITWWPLAPGWWLLGFLILAAIAITAHILYSRYQARRYRRLGCAQLKQLHADYRENDDTRGFLSAANALLKSVALQAYPANQVAASHGSEWADFLNNSVSGKMLFDASFTAAIYQENVTGFDADAFHGAAEHWIKHHRVKPAESQSSQVSQ